MNKKAVRPAGPFLVLSLALAVSPALAAAQQWDGRSLVPPAVVERGDRDAREALLGWDGITGSRQFLASANITESEPNDSLFLSDSVMLGDVIDGVIGSAGDFDYFNLDLVAGDIIDVDIDAFVLGSALDPVVAFFRIDTTPGALQPIDTVIVALSDNGDLLDSRIIWDVVKDGTYFVGLRDLDFGGSANHTYTLNLRARTRQEIEPGNDMFGGAQVLTPGDSSLGFVNPTGDKDYYAVDLTAGSSLQIDTDAQDVGSVLFTSLRLFDTDGTTLLNFAAGAVDVQLRFFTPTAGRFFIEVADRDGLGGSAFFYTIKLDTIAPGPGDPTVLYASGLGQPGGIIAGPTGELYVVDLLDDRLIEVAADGSTRDVVQLAGMTDVTVDGFGDILVTGFQLQALIWSVKPDGTTSVFSSKPQFPGAITVGADGDIWTSDASAEMIWRIDPRGVVKDSVPTPNIGLPVFDMAFSPSGVLHFTNRGNLVMKVENGAAVAAFQTDVTAEGIAFDRDGYLYLSNGFERRIALYDPAYQLVDPNFIITNLGGPVTVSFGRSSDGSMTSRLFAANNSFGILPPFAGGIVEANAAGIRAPGFRIGVDLLLISESPLDSGLVGDAYSDTLVVDDFAGPVTWSIVSGDLPTGLSLDAATGEIFGIPEEAGTFEFTARADSGDRLGEGAVSITVGTPIVVLQDVVDELLGSDGLLSDALKGFVDITGNRNGILDIGDLRALLRREGSSGVNIPTARQSEEGQP